jgi:hypothetical protein
LGLLRQAKCKHSRTIMVKNPKRSKNIMVNETLEKIVIGIEKEL